MDKKNIRWLALFFLLGGLGGCIEPFDTEVAGVDGLVVVNGQITDQPGPYRITLSRSASLNDSTFKKINNTQVYIEEENGVKEQLKEHDPGTYFTSEGGIRGQVGKRYQLTIQLSGGAQYASAWVTVIKSPEVDSVYYLFEEKPVGNDIEKGFQIYVDSEDPTGNVRFFRYEWIETWKYSAPFSPRPTYVGGDNGLELGPTGPNRFCWQTDTFTNVINLSSSLNNNTTGVIQHPIAFVSTTTSKLLNRYSILLKQFALEEEEFEFWKGLQETSTGNGSVFDKQPQVITGNMQNVNDPDEPVLGYFSASTFSEKRIYINRSALPDGIVPDLSLLFECQNGLDSLARNDNFKWNLLRQINLGRAFFGFYGVIDVAGAILTMPECVDCTLQGGVVTAPDFWIANDD